MLKNIEPRNTYYYSMPKPSGPIKIEYEVYDGAELRLFTGRPGAMDAFSLPSVIGDRRVWRDGRGEAV